MPLIYISNTKLGPAQAKAGANLGLKHLLGRQTLWPLNCYPPPAAQPQPTGPFLQQAGDPTALWASPPGAPAQAVRNTPRWRCLCLPFCACTPYTDGNTETTRGPGRWVTQGVCGRGAPDSQSPPSCCCVAKQGVPGAGDRQGARQTQLRSRSPPEIGKTGSDDR